jgi:hypothetical protein
MELNCKCCVDRERTRLHNEDLYDLHSSPNIIRMIKSSMRRAGHVARTMERTSAYSTLKEKPEGKRPITTPRRRWNNNKMDLQEMGWWKRLD